MKVRIEEFGSVESLRLLEAGLPSAGKAGAALQLVGTATHAPLDAQRAELAWRLARLLAGLGVEQVSVDGFVAGEALLFFLAFQRRTATPESTFSLSSWKHLPAVPPALKSLPAQKIPVAGRVLTAQEALEVGFLTGGVTK